MSRPSHPEAEEIRHRVLLALAANRALGFAAITACAAAPQHPHLSALAAWYISPGQGRALKITSRRFHEGRSFAAVRTEIKNADGSQVLEVVSHHAA